MILKITRNRALAVAQASNPVAAELGEQMCGFFNRSLAAESLMLIEADAETAAGALMGTDLLTERERDDYMASAYV